MRPSSLLPTGPKRGGMAAQPLVQPCGVPLAQPRPSTLGGETMSVAEPMSLDKKKRRVRRKNEKQQHQQRLQQGPKANKANKGRQDAASQRPAAKKKKAAAARDAEVKSLRSALARKEAEVAELKAHQRRVVTPPAPCMPSHPSALKARVMVPPAPAKQSASKSSKPCKFWLEGRCTRGATCKFVHPDRRPLKSHAGGGNMSL